MGEVDSSRARRSSMRASEASICPWGAWLQKTGLLNLFFATLNQEMGKREFRKTGQNFMAHNVYRYHPGAPRSKARRHI
jgi:hypothetical protein